MHFSDMAHQLQINELACQRDTFHCTFTAVSLVALVEWHLLMYESAWYYSGLLWWLDDFLAVRVLMVVANKVYRSSYCFFRLSVIFSFINTVSVRATVTHLQWKYISYIHFVVPYKHIFKSAGCRLSSCCLWLSVTLCCKHVYVAGVEV